jgi:hypothetical protein
MDNPERTEQVPSAVDLLVAELREQIRFLREEFSRAREEADEQLAAKDAQIERLLSLLEGRFAAEPAAVLMETTEGEEEELEIPAETEPDRVETTPVDDLPSVPVETLKEELEIPAETEPDRVETTPVDDLPSVPVETLKQVFKANSCPYLRARYDQAVIRTYATGSNACWSPRITKVRGGQYGTIDKDHQGKYCLQDRHTQCVYFESTTETPAEAASEAAQEKRWWQRKGWARR